LGEWKHFTGDFAIIAPGMAFVYEKGTGQARGKRPSTKSIAITDRNVILAGLVLCHRAACNGW
jgi:hypothetical protein